MPAWTPLDDRGLRPGAMFADMELIGIPHRVVVANGLAAGTTNTARAAPAKRKAWTRPPCCSVCRLIRKDRAPVFLPRSSRYCSGHNPVKITATAPACRHAMTRLHLCCD